MNIIRNLNKVFMGEDPENYTLDDLAKQITQAQKQYLDLLYKQKHFDTYKKKFFTNQNWNSIANNLAVSPEVTNNGAEDLFIFNFRNVPIKLYLGNYLNKQEYDYPHSSAVYYSSAPIYGFEVRLMKRDARFKNTTFPNHTHPHIHHTDKSDGYTSLHPLCVGNHKFRDKINLDMINDSNELTSTLLDMFQWLLEVNYHDNYGSLMCPLAEIPTEIKENTDIKQLEKIIKQFTYILTQENNDLTNVTYPSWLNKDNMTALTIRNFAYAVFLMHTKGPGTPTWEYNILSQDINYYYNATRVRQYTTDREMLHAPETNCKILNNTRGGEHALCFMN